MGYESKVIVARVYEGEGIDNKYGVYDIIAELDLSKMTGEFTDLFTKKLEHGYHEFGRDENITEDMYGEKLTYAKFKDVYEWCLNNVASVNYRRLDLLLAVLNAVRTGWAYDTDNIIIIHYGY